MNIGKKERKREREGRTKKNSCPILTKDRKQALLFSEECCSSRCDSRYFINNATEYTTVMCYITTIRSTMNRIYNGGPIDYNGTEKYLLPGDVIAVMTS